LRNSKKRVLVLSDLHCGNIFGLTHPNYFNSFREIQQIGWDFFQKSVKSLGEIDLLILNGDLVDGPGKKDTRQHITTDMKEQVDMAIAVLETIPAKKIIFIRGTCFHVTTDRENEDDIASFFKSEIYDSKKIDVNGCILHCKHTVGKGSTVYGSITPLQSNSALQVLNDVASGNETADIFIRSHIHEYNMVDREPFTAITTPGLQFKGMAYGRRYNSFYSYGMVHLDIRDKKDFDVGKILLTETGGNYKKEEILKI
jgi:hypothetical protein